jgi:hypothetical protein
MKKAFTINSKNSLSIKYGSSASSFWSDDDFDTTFKVGSNLDFTKLAATQRAIANFVNIVTGKQIPVAFQSNDSSYTDGERVVIGTKLEDKNFDPAVGLALHEGSHIAYTDFDLLKGQKLSNTKMAQAVRMNGLDPDMMMSESDFAVVKDLLNWVEDRRIDYKIYTIAPGYRMYYEAMYDKYFNDSIIDKALIAQEKNQETWDDYIFHIINFTNPNRQLDTLKSLRQIWNVVDLKNINRLKNTHDALLVAIDIYKIIKDTVGKSFSAEEVENTFKQSGFGAGNTGNGNNSGGSSPQLQSNTDPSGEPSDAVDSDDNGEDETDDVDGDNGSNNGNQNKSQFNNKQLDKLQKAIDAQKSFLKGTQKKQGRLSKSQSALVNALRESGTESRIVYTGLDGGMSGALTTVVIKKLTPAVICSMPSLFLNYADDVLSGKRSIDNSNMHWARCIQNMDNAVTRGVIMGKQLGNKLQLRNSDRSLKTTRLQSGKIDRRLVSQLGYENVNVFHRIVTDKYKNYFIHISIDASGSMSGTKFYNAITSAVAIAQAASMTTGIRVQISLRGTDNMQAQQEKCVTMYAYDSAHDKMSKIRKLFKYLDTFGCTPEGVAFKSIEKDLKADAKGDELIFINYSDGAPTTVHGASYDGVTFTQKVVNNMKSNGINVISYFISESTWESEVNAFRKMYGPDAQFINPLSILQVAKTMNNKFMELAD